VNNQKDLLRFLTAGNVDDGKSTLIGRLLADSKKIFEDQLASLTCDSAKKGWGEGEIDYSLLLDGLKAEREQGITIDVAYRYFSTHKRKFIIADTPGHEQYTRNMATGASTANLLVLLISANQGMTEQTKRHSYIATLMGIKHVVVVVNKMDLVNYSQNTFEEIKQAYLQFALHLPPHEVHFIPTAAFKGDNVVEKSRKMPWYHGGSLLHYLESVEVAQDANFKDVRFPIQLVIRPNQTFRGYAGTLASGVLRQGDEVRALPSLQTSRVRSILQYEEELKEALPSQAVTITLDHEIDLSRGNMLVGAQDLSLSKRHLRAMLIWMDALQEAHTGGTYLLKHTTQTVPAVLKELVHKIDIKTFKPQETKQLQLNEIAEVDLELHRPIFADSYSQNRANGGFILIDRDSNQTVAAGLILETKEIKSTHITHHNALLSNEERRELIGQTGCVVWLTGLPGSGKSTLAYALEKKLLQSDRLAYVLDGDNLRYGLNSDLGFSQEDRREHIRRLGEVASLFAQAGCIIIVAAISPYRCDRDKARRAAPENRFFEVYLSTSLNCCEKRDPKGLYKKARKGEIQSFTGISAPYEAPLAPDLMLDTEVMDQEACVRELLRKI
jgi:bifunctional enzyme CysN/CysC